MRSRNIIALFLLFLSTACVSVSGEAPTDAPAVFVTSTLPPTKPGLTLPTDIPPTASPTLDPEEPTPTPTCRDSAVFVEDVTYPDNTRLESGEKFTKTWKLQNTGSCTWTGYTVAIFSGDQMDAPESVPVPETEVSSTVEVSVDLVAPAEDGAYTGNFELRNAKGESIPLGTEPTFWVKIVVGEEGTAAEQTIGNCTYTENPEYVKTLIDLINQARADVGRPALTINAQLTAAARARNWWARSRSPLRISASAAISRSIRASKSARLGTGPARTRNNLRPSTLASLTVTPSMPASRSLPASASAFSSTGSSCLPTCRFSASAACSYPRACSSTT